MPLIAYSEVRFSPASLAKIEKANEIIAEYRGHGLDLTLRQLYYQFVSRGLIPNNDREYKKLGSVIADGRECGLIDWNAIVDRTRYVRQQSHWDNPQSIVSACADKAATIALLLRLGLWDFMPPIEREAFCERGEVWDTGTGKTIMHVIRAHPACIVRRQDQP